MIWALIGVAVCGVTLARWFRAPAIIAATALLFLAMVPVSSLLDLPAWTAVGLALALGFTLNSFYLLGLRLGPFKWRQKA